MTYEKIGVRHLRKELSGVLSRVETNQQRLIVGKNSDEIAAIVPICDLHALTELDEKRAQNAENAVVKRDMETETGTEHENLNSMFSSFKEREIDESRYEDEETDFDVTSEVVKFDVNKELAFEFSPNENERSVAAAMEELPIQTRSLFGKIYKMIDEAVVRKSDQVNELYNGLAAILADDQSVKPTIVVCRGAEIHEPKYLGDLGGIAALKYDVLTSLAKTSIRRRGISISEMDTNAFFKKD